jgi:hypothetical protein
MYGLPKDFDASFLVGLTLEMVCFNINQVYLHFSDHVMITIEGDLVHQISPSDDTSNISPPIHESNLMQLLEHSVSNAFGDDEGTLTMVFDNGQTLKCLDTSPNYESYQIKHGEHIIIV